jgi:hypothetical protein
MSVAIFGSERISLGGLARGMARPSLTLTFCPYDPVLIDVGMLTADERDWVDSYHREVLAKIGPLVAGEALERVTGRL